MASSVASGGLGPVQAWSARAIDSSIGTSASSTVTADEAVTDTVRPVPTSIAIVARPSRTRSIASYPACAFIPGMISKNSSLP